MTERAVYLNRPGYTRTRRSGRPCRGAEQPARRNTLRLFWIGLLALLLIPVPAGAQAGLDQELAQAESSYARGDFDEAIRILSTTLSRATSEAQAIAGYRLLILTHLQREEATEAKLAIVRLLHFAPAYMPDPVQDPPTFVNLVNVIKSQLLTSAAADPATSSCEQETAEAEAHYVAGAFEEAARLLSGCLNQHFLFLSPTQAAAALRLLTLARLKQGALHEAKLAAMRLLSLSPTYAPDPVRDLPAYTAFIELIARQMATSTPNN